MKTTEHTLGTLIHLDRCTVLFGNKNSTKSSFAEYFPEVDQYSVHQVHETTIVPAAFPMDSDTIKADGTFTQKLHLALAIKTADCAPVFLYCSKTRTVLAVHAGWRGIANKIVSKAVKKLIEISGDSDGLIALVGPHIQMSSFEVKADVKDLLLASISNPQAHYIKERSTGHYLVNLSELIVCQLQEMGVPSKNIFCSKVNTYSDLNYHSFRRDKANSGRQLSFIFLT